jgi:hypothetical protein
MRTQTGTDLDIQCLCSCEVCGNWYWRPQAGIFICDTCRVEREHQRGNVEYRDRNRKIHKKPTNASVYKASAIFGIIVKHRLTGIKQADIQREMIHRGWKELSMSPDYLGMLDYTGHLVWTDEFGNLRPYRNLNTGERYE